MSQPQVPGGERADEAAARADSREREMQELLRRASTAIGNLQAVARRQHPYNKVTAESVRATQQALSDFILGGASPQRECFVVIERCEGYTAKCRCGWQQHHGSKFSARYDAIEHELNQPTPSGESRTP